MKALINILILLSLENAFSAEANFVWTMADGKGIKKIQLIETKEKILVTENCLKSCKAIEVLNGKPAVTSPGNKALIGNPASTFCNSIGGVVRILKDPKGDEYDFCQFPDQSMIDTWQMMKVLKK